MICLKNLQILFGRYTFMPLNNLRDKLLQSRVHTLELDRLPISELFPWPFSCTRSRILLSPRNRLAKKPRNAFERVELIDTI